MKKFFASLMIIATLAFIVPFEAFAQTTMTRRVYRNGRVQTTRVHTQTNRGNHYGWRNRNRGNRYGWRNRGVTPQERARLNRQRMRLYNTRNRITRDGMVTEREARRWNKQTNRHQRTMRKVRNN
jgi:hypothetical protein